MKRAGLVVAGVIVALLVTDAAFAASRLSGSSRSTRSKSEDDKDTRTTVGNVRSISSGNVRRTSDTSTRTTSSARTVHVVTTPKVSSSSSHISTTSGTSKTVSSRVTTRPRVVSTRPKVTTTPTRPRIDVGRSVVEATSTIERTDGGRLLLQPGNVRTTGGNVLSAGGKVPDRIAGFQGRTPRRVSESDDHDWDHCHHHRPHPWPPRWKFVHDDWDTHIIIVEVEPAQEIVYAPAPRVVEDPYIAKGQIQDATITTELPLTTVEWRRAEVLVSRGIVGSVLEEAGAAAEYDYELDARWGRLRLTAPSEQVAMIETMIRDARTFEAMTEPNRYGYAAAVISVVSPYYLDQDARAGAGLAGDNFGALWRMLQDADWRYAYHGKACWLNAAYGTVTIVDEPENIDRAAAFVDDLPFVPRDMVHE
jgi:hypothetical protein